MENCVRFESLETQNSPAFMQHVRRYWFNHPFQQCRKLDATDVCWICFMGPGYGYFEATMRDKSVETLL